MWVLGPEQQGAQLVEGWGTAPKSDPFRRRRATPAKARIQRLARAPRGEPAAASSEQIPQRPHEDAGADGDQFVGKVLVGIVEVWAVFARAQEEHRGGGLLAEAAEILRAPHRQVSSCGRGGYAARLSAARSNMP
jgi:hypothetical protein